MRPVVFLVLLVLPLRGMALSGYFGFSPTDQRTKKPTLSLGFYGEEWMGGISATFNSEFSEKDFTVDAPIPHTSYEDLGEKRVGNTMGIDVFRIWEPFEGYPQVFLGGGVYFERVSRVVRSTATGWYWSQSKTTNTLIALGGGIIHDIGEPGGMKTMVSINSVLGLGIGLTNDF